MKNPRKILLARRTADFLLSLQDSREGDITEGKVDFAHKLDRMELRFLSETIEKERNRD